MCRRASCDPWGSSSERKMAAGHAAAAFINIASFFVLRHVFFAETFSTVPVKFRHGGDVRCTTALPPKAEVDRRSCYVAFVPKCMAWPCGTRWTSKINEREGCIHVSGLLRQIAP